MTKTELLKAYEETTKADCMVIGFAVNEDAYMVTMKNLREDMVKLDRESSSHGGILKLRLRLTVRMKAILKGSGAIKIGKVSEVLAGRKNAGEAFEKWIKEHYKQEYKHNSIPYWKDGDITVYGRKIQIKWENASLANEQTIQRVLQRG